MKPRIFKMKTRWVCMSNRFGRDFKVGSGPTPADAYMAWAWKRVCNL